MESATTEVVQLVATQVIADLQPWIEREKAQHIKRAVRMAKRGFERIERLWDERDLADSQGGKPCCSDPRQTRRNHQAQPWNE